MNSPPKQNPLSLSLIALLRPQTRRAMAERATHALARSFPQATVEGISAVVDQDPENPLLVLAEVALNDPSQLRPMATETLRHLAGAVQKAAANGPKMNRDPTR